MSGLENTPLAAKAVVLHLGTEAKGLPAERSSTDPLVAVCAASLLPVKGHTVLLQAMEQLNQAGVSLELWLAGDGHLRPALELEARNRGVEERVRFLGLLPHSSLLELYASGTISIAVLASADLGHGLHEAIPVSLMEAMSFAIPVIATDTGGVSELLGGGAGVLVPPHDPVAMAQALHLLAVNADLRRSLGRAGQQRVMDSFAAGKIARELGELFFSHRVAVPAA